MLDFLSFTFLAWDSQEMNGPVVPSVDSIFSFTDLQEKYHKSIVNPQICSSLCKGGREKWLYSKSLY